MKNSKNPKFFSILFALIFFILINTNQAAYIQQTQSSLSLQPSSPSQISIDAKSIQVTKIYPDSSGTIIFTIANTGGLPAEEVVVTIPSSQNFHIGDKIKIGTLNPGTQQSIKATIKAGNITPGVYTITVFVDYKKQKKTNYEIERGSVEENFYIPINVYAPPTTELRVKNKDLFLNKKNELNLEIIPKTNLRDTSVELISNCLQVVGNSKIYLGDLKANKGKGITFNVIPIKKGCNTRLNLIYKAGDYKIEALNFGVNVKDIFVDFLTQTEKKEISPGDSVNLTIKVKNLGNVMLSNVKFSLNLPDQFVVANEEFFNEILPGEEKVLNFQIYVKSDAETKPYKGDLNIDYEISGNKYRMHKNIGIPVKGRISIVITHYKIEKDKVYVEVANIGTRTAKSLILKFGNGYYYIDKIEGSHKRTAIFKLKDVKNADKIAIEYTGDNNKRIKFEEKISLTLSDDNGINNLAIFVLVIVVVGVIGFYVYKKRGKEK